MEKDSHHTESMATVNIKPEYPPSEYSSEPPPAYHKPQSSAVQVAKIVAVTVVLVSVVLGSFLLASAYVSANSSCRQLEQELELLSEAADRFQQPPQAEALIQDEPVHQKRQSDPLQTEETKNTKDIDNSIDSSESSDSSDSSSSSESDDEEEDERTPIHFKLPLQLDFDDLAGALVEKNQKSRMNCIVEKKRAEEVVDHQPKTLRLPFGVNLTTDPRYERLSGERMVIVCESGHMQRAQPQPAPQPEEEEQDTIMIQPVMIPIPHTAFQTHMPQQMQPAMQQPQPQPQPIHPMETMRPPMPPMMPPHIQIQAQQPQRQQNDFLPTPIQHIIQQIIAQKIMASQKAQEEQQAQEAGQQEVEQRVRVNQVPEGMQIAQRIPIPEEILSQLNRLPHNDRVIVAVSEPEDESSSEENDSQDIRLTSGMRVIQDPRQSAAEMNGRQTYARGLPVHIPVPMMQQVQEQEPQAAASDDSRPHYVQPRSVPSEEEPKSRVARSANPLLPEKRIKRCACDCAC